MTNQTPVEYCRHENCGKEIEPCRCKVGHGYVHVNNGTHFCFLFRDQVAEPADPPQTPDTLIDPNHPEAFCSECGGVNICWFAPNEVWNAVIPSRVGILCPTCFVRKAEAIGSTTGWELKPEYWQLKAGTQMEERKPFCEVTVSHGAPPAPSPAPWENPPKCESANREPQASQRCDTTNTVRYDIGSCNCLSLYTSDLGPCITWEEGARAGTCVYCTHSKDCHLKAAAKVERELQELRATVEYERNDKIAWQERAANQRVEATSLRGLVEDICETVSEIGWCSICGRTDCGKNPLVHKPTCLISEAEAAIKEPHNGENVKA